MSITTPVFHREPKSRQWVATVHGFKGYGRTKRLAQKNLREKYVANDKSTQLYPVRWVREDSPFFK